jgi:hypothetical protein
MFQLFPALILLLLQSQNLGNRGLIDCRAEALLRAHYGQDLQTALGGSLLATQNTKFGSTYAAPNRFASGRTVLTVPREAVIGHARGYLLTVFRIDLKALASAQRLRDGPRRDLLGATSAI